jgi:hypothetical protein
LNSYFLSISDFSATANKSPSWAPSQSLQPRVYCNEHLRLLVPLPSGWPGAIVSFPGTSGHTITSFPLSISSRILLPVAAIPSSLRVARCHVCIHIRTQGVLSRHCRYCTCD